MQCASTHNAHELKFIAVNRCHLFEVFFISLICSRLPQSNSLFGINAIECNKMHFIELMASKLAFLPHQISQWIVHILFCNKFVCFDSPFYLFLIRIFCSLAKRSRWFGSYVACKSSYSFHSCSACKSSHLFESSLACKSSYSFVSSLANKIICWQANIARHRIKCGMCSTSESKWITYLALMGDWLYN